MEFRYGHWLQRVCAHVMYTTRAVACIFKNVSDFRKNGKPSRVFSPPRPPADRKRAANLTISSARRVFLDPTGYKSNGRRNAYGPHKGVFRARSSRRARIIRVRRDGCSSRLRRSNRFGDRSYKWTEIATECKALKTAVYWRV